MPTMDAPLDLTKNELRNAVLQNLASAPSSPIAGQAYHDTVLLTSRFYNGTVWLSVGDDIPKSTITGANAIVYGTAANTPAALVPALDSLVGRATGVNSGNLTGLTATQVRTFLGALSGFTAPSASLDLNSQKIINLQTPSASTDAATMGYVDNAIAAIVQGLDWKGSVRAATTAAGTLATSFANGQTIDGVTLVTGNRILIKNQAAPAENGIYTVNASGAPTRATDMDTSAEASPGSTVVVEEGTTLADSTWTLTTNAPITLGTTGLVWAQPAGAGGTVFGTSNRITVTGGNTIDIAATYVGQSSITTVGALASGSLTTGFTAVAVAQGGTGGTTTATAKTSLGFMTRYTQTIGNGSLTSFTINHNLGTTDVIVAVYAATGGLERLPDVVHTDANNVTLQGYTTAPATNSLKVVVIG